MSKEDNELFDSDDFSEIVLKQLIRSEAAYESARAHKLQPEDLAVGPKGFQLYKDFAKIAFKIDNSPCDKSIFKMHLNQVRKDKSFEAYESETVDALIDDIFDGEPGDADYVINSLNAFMKRRRMLKVVNKYDKADDLDAIQVELSKIHDDMQAIQVSSVEECVSPFETYIASEKISGILTGVGVMDKKTGGLGKGECGLLIGHSGSGKTAVASYMMRQAALYGFNALYISAEEPMRNIIHRWYAQQFGISYSAMHRGDDVAEFDKREAFSNIDAETRQKLARLRISDVRAAAPLNWKTIRDVIEKRAQEGFVADVVLIDQMDYLKPERSMAKGAGKWQEYEAVSFECDMLSQYRIGGQAEFGLWVVHQATGDMQWEFTYNDIAGFKGIVKPFDLAVGVGREDRQSNHVNLFSLKVRHTEHFSAPQKAEFEFMRFEDDTTYKPKAMREKEQKKQQGKTKPAKNEMKENVSADSEE